MAPTPPHTLSQRPFRCPLRWVLVSGKQKGQSESQLVIKRETGASPATDSQNTQAPVRHVLLVYTGNKPAPEVSLHLDMLSPTLDTTAVTFRYFVDSKRLLFDCPSNNTQPGKVVDLYFPDSPGLQQTVSVLNGLGLQCQSCGGTVPTITRCQSSTGYPQRSMLNPSPSFPILSPDIFRSTHAFSPPLMLQSPEGRVTPVQIRRVGKRKRLPTAAASNLDPRLQSQSPIPPFQSSLEGPEMARPSSVPAALQRPIVSQLAVDTLVSPYFQQPSQQPNSILETPLEPTLIHNNNEVRSEERSPRRGPMRREAESAVPREGGSNHGTTPVAPSNIDTAGMNQSPERLVDSLKSTAANSKRAPQVSRSTQCGTTYEDAQSQTGDGDTSKSAISDDGSCRLLDVVDVWENMRQELQKTVDSTEFDDAALLALVLNYQHGLEEALGQFPDI